MRARPTDAPADATSELFYSSSSDAGVTWSKNVALSAPFNHSLGYPQQDKLGDYYDMISDNRGFNLAYAATFNGEQDVYFLRAVRDCNENGSLDEVDLMMGTSLDCNGNEIPDECELADGGASDCNLNDVPDECDIAGITSDDCDGGLVPDECEIAACAGDAACADCNANGVPDGCELADCVDDPGCDDCNGNMVLDVCDVTGATSDDCDANGVPDDCQLDVDGDGVINVCDPCPFDALDGGVRHDVGRAQWPHRRDLE